MSKLYVGFGRRDITPEEYMPMGGFVNDKERICSVVWDRLQGSCIALRDEAGQTVILCTMDLLYTPVSTVTRFVREGIRAATGIGPEYVMVGATHNHSGPAGNDLDDPPTARYLHYLGKQMGKAAADALEDLQETTISVGQKTGFHLSFDRHYITHDGEVYRPGLGGNKSGIKCHMDDADEQLQMIRFSRKAGRDILLVNWQSHVTFVGNIRTDTEMSADYVGVMRDHVEGVTGCKVAFFQGAGGNMAPWSRIPEENRIEKGDYRSYGKLLAELALETLDALQPVSAGPLQIKQLQYPAKVDHSDDHLAPMAQKALDAYWASDLIATKRKEVMQPYGFTSMNDAYNLLSRANAPETMEMELDVISAGDISFATLPFEMYCSNGKYIKENTPFAMTFVLGYCNGYFSYLVDKKGFQYSTYEVRARQFLEGTAEDIAKTHVEMLTQLKEKG